MDWFVWVVVAALVGWLLWQLGTGKRRLVKAQRDLRVSSKRADGLYAELTRMQADLDRVRPYLDVADAAVEAERLGREAIDKAQALEQAAQERAQALTERAEAAAGIALREARSAVADARKRARELELAAEREAQAVAHRAAESARLVLQAAQQQAGEAVELVGQEQRLRARIEALENRLRGYDDRYIQPAALLLEGLAHDYGQDDAAVELKAARAYTRALMADGLAAACDYVEANRRETAVRFVVDAFNGAADAILTRVRTDNAGKLEQELADAAAVVNMHGQAFRNARVTDVFVEARSAELRASARFQAVLKREQEEQRAIRERIREEARAQREFEASRRAAQRDEERVRKALEDARARFEAAAQEDRAKLEARMAELQEALAEAEAKNQRALSMAQQTRAGHCYIVSNEGSFGVDVLKIGMTRRLDPMDRVRELGGASVPFEFDVHAMIYSDDAPRLERELHREFNEARVNMVNPRKEFFRVGVAAVREKLDALGVRAHFTLAAAAREYRETLALQQADVERRRSVLQAVLDAEDDFEEDAEDLADLGQD